MTAAIRPTTEIVVPENHVRAVLATFGVTEAVAVVGIRGFTKSIAGSASGKNLSGAYDDAICVATPDEVQTFAGNTDPSRQVAGRAILETGRKYRYTRGIHGITGPKEKQRKAFVQAGGVDIRRVGRLGVLEAGVWIGLNIHDGSWTTTGSAGCQTVVPERWPAFYRALDDALAAAKQEEFWYVLVA